MRTRDVFDIAETYEIRSLFLHLLNAKRHDSPPDWWQQETKAWCANQPDRLGYDSRPHLLVLVDRILELEWDDNRLKRLLDLHLISRCDLPTAGMTTRELLMALRDLVATDLLHRPVMRRAHG
jgi:hypothetical protein